MSSNALSWDARSMVPATPNAFLQLAVLLMHETMSRERRLHS